MSEALYERLQRLKKQGADSRCAGESSGMTGSPRKSGGADIAGDADIAGGADIAGDADIAGGADRAGGPVAAGEDRALARMGFEPTTDGIWRRIVRRDIGAAAERLRRLGRHGGYLAEEHRAAEEHHVAGEHRAAEEHRVAGEHRVAEDESSLLFFDAETTGLSAGAGTFAFLVGGATVSGDERQSLEVTQLLLPDYPFEPEFLAYVAGLLSPEKTLVSYNGKGFDTHVLRSRFLMNGVQWSEPPQIDLLYTARRLWKPVLPDCRLGTIEHHVLGVEREIDLPGKEVPERYFAFLETGVGEVLREVVAHHEQDMVSLALLLDAVEYALSSHVRAGSLRPDASPPSSPSSESGHRSQAVEHPPTLRVVPDLAGTARMLLQSEPDYVISLLRERCDFYSPFGANRRAMVLLAGLLKRRKRYEEAAAVWSALFHTGRSGIAGLELAKHLEHREKNPAAALAVCDELSALGLPKREALEHRRERLRKKLRKAPRPGRS
ncbi:MAG: ribonuclease H-like domain-containing protein [Spirochaetia bacterium]